MHNNRTNRLLYRISYLFQEKMGMYQFCRREGMDVRGISGDHVKMVFMIVKRAGLEKWKKAVDMSGQGESSDHAD